MLKSRQWIIILNFRSKSCNSYDVFQHFQNSSYYILLVINVFFFLNVGRLYRVRLASLISVQNKSYLCYIQHIQTMYMPYRNIDNYSHKVINLLSL